MTRLRAGEDDHGIMAMCGGEDRVGRGSEFKTGEGAGGGTEEHAGTRRRGATRGCVEGHEGGGVHDRGSRWGARGVRQRSGSRGARGGGVSARRGAGGSAPREKKWGRGRKKMGQLFKKGERD